jgi:hypothetical protein
MQQKLFVILKEVLGSLKKELAIKTSDSFFPLSSSDLTEMSTSEFNACLKSLPDNFSSPYVFDLSRIRSMLEGFGSHSRSQLLKQVMNFERDIKDQFYNYKGFK